MKHPLTKKQHETLVYLKKFNDKHGYMPSIEEIARHFGIGSISIFERIDRLQAKGWIKRKKFHPRHITVI